MELKAVAPAPKLMSNALYTAMALLFTLLWASAFIAVKVGLRSGPPLFLMGFRFLIAGTGLLIYARVRGYAFPNAGRDWGRLSLIGLLNNGAYLGLAVLALRHLSSGMGAIITSTNPLMLAMVAPIFLGERLTRVKITGFVLAFASVFGIMYSRIGTDDRPSAMALMLFGNALMVAGTVLFKRWVPSQDLTVVNGIQLFASSIFLLVPSLLLEPVAATRWDANFLGAVAYLVLVISCGAMMIWFHLLRSGDASRASAFFFLTPVLGLFLGALVLGEQVHAFDFVGALGVAWGIYMVQRSR